MLVFAITGFVVVLAFWAGVEWASRRMRTEFQSRLSALAASVKNLERDAGERAAQTDNRDPVKISSKEAVTGKSPSPIAVLPSERQESTPIPDTPVSDTSFPDQPFLDTPSVIAATISAMLGHSVKIRTIKLVDDPDTTTNWATQGRIAIQSSHSLRATRD